MLGRLLHPLPVREQSLLLALMTFGGRNADGLLAHIPDELHAGLLEKKARLEEIPREKRLPVMIKHLRSTLSYNAPKGLEGVEPSWLIAGFKGESPRTVAIVLMHMPTSVARQIVRRLPKAVQDAMPARTELRDVSMDVVKLVRARFDAKFAAMPRDRELSEFAYQDLVIVSARDLIALVREIGLAELAAAFVALGKRALAALLRRLPRENQEELLAAVKRVAGGQQMDLKVAELFLAKVLQSFHNTDELYQKAGLYRLARASQDESPLFLRQLSQRFPRAHGRLLADYVRKVSEMDAALLGMDEKTRLRRDVVETLLELARRGKVHERFAQAKALHDER